MLLEEHNTDLIICLSHLGYSYKEDKVSDKILAAQTSHTDLIIGGHTHTFLQKPDLIKNLNKTVVNNFKGIIPILVMYHCNTQCIPKKHFVQHLLRLFFFPKATLDYFIQAVIPDISHANAFF